MSIIKKNQQVWIISQLLTLVSLPLFYYFIGPALATNVSDKGAPSTVAFVLGLVSIVLAILSLNKLNKDRKLVSVIGFSSGIVYFFYAWLANALLTGLTF